MTGRRDRVTVALWAELAVLFVWNVIGRPLTPSAAQFPGNLAVAGVVCVLAALSGLSAEDLGLARRHLASGARYGMAVVGLVVAVLTAGALISPTALTSTPDAHMPVPRMLLTTLIVIPLGTVAFEELAFRGLMFGALRRRFSTRSAVVVSSLLFGAWHVDAVVRRSGDPMHAVVAALGTFIFTTLVGVGFCWLRLRSGSLLAPALAHVASNSLGLAAAVLLAH